jgi:hypothetical protein
MNLELLKLPFKEDEIEWRIGQCGKKGNGQIWAMCLAYVQARAIMNRLDEVCGPENWKVEYSFPSVDAVICRLSIYVISSENDVHHQDFWVTKEDGAEQTDIESFKGGISSALKRAGSVWGIGRYLYGLETGFAQVRDQKNGNTRYGKTKDGTEFHWEPPKLPQWALPAGEKADISGIHPQEPKDGDGIVRDGFVIPGLPKPLIDRLGRNPAGQMLEDLSKEDLMVIATFTEDKYPKESDIPEKTLILYRAVCARIFEMEGV